MDTEPFFKSIIDSDAAPVVICDLSHTVVYMNPAAAEKYAKRGGYALVGRSLLDCHSSRSAEQIKAVVRWFEKSPHNNRVFTFHNSRENRDVYMIALRDGSGGLIGYYEKHEYRNAESSKPYEAICDGEDCE